jgi:chromosome segregation protein
MEVAEKSLEDAKSNRETLATAFDDGKAKVKSIRDNLSNLEAKGQNIDKEMSHLHIQRSQHTARKKTIEEMENNYEGYNAAVRFIMKGKLRGIEGVTADLMTVPKEFEVAVETALGASMQNIVCQKDEDAKQAVKSLKENKAGRATFLPIESIRGIKANVPEAITKASGFRGLACDVINFDSKYQGIFAYLLGRAAIVDNMQTAIELSKKAGGSIRFVTVEGEIVNASGAITGGKYKNATANLLERKGEISRLAGEISKIEQKLFDAQKERNEISKNMESLTKELTISEEHARNMEIELMGIEAKISNAMESSKDVRENASRHEQMLISIDKDLENAMNMAKKLEEEAEECQKQGEQTQESIEALMKESEALKLQSDKASDEITATRIEKNKIDSSEENISTLLNRLNSSILEFNEQIEVKTIELSQFESEKIRLLAGNDNVEERTATLTAEKEELEEYIMRVTAEKAELSEKVEEMTKQQLAFAENLNAYQDQKYQQEIKLAKNETQLDTFKEKLWEEFEISYLQAMSFKKDDFVMSTAQKESRDIKNRMRELGDVNVGSIQEYAQVKERYDFLSEQKKDITSAMDQLKAIVDDMEKTIKTRFKENFDKIVINFEGIFKALFGGGHAELRLDNEDNPLESGIEIIAQPPGKKLQNINLMSGGEKTMTAIALMFAVLKTTPTPFCILDEVEAALDDHNIDRFAKYLRKFHDIQFAIVTHQKVTMEHADVLYGVTMPEQGISKVLSLRLGDNFDLG